MEGGSEQRESGEGVLDATPAVPRPVGEPPAETQESNITQAQTEESSTKEEENTGLDAKQDPSEKDIAKAEDSKSPAAATVETDLEKAKPKERRWRPHRSPRFIRKITSFPRRICSASVGCLGGIGLGALIILGAAVVLLPLILYAVYMYFLNYAKIYPGSKVAYDVFRNKNSDTAFQFFYWFTCCLASGYIGLGFIALVSAGDLEDEGALLCCLLPFVIGLVTMPYWLRFPIMSTTHNSVFLRTCDDWDIRTILSSISWPDYEWSLPTQVVNITVTMSKAIIMLGIFRRQLNPLVYDMIISNATQGFYSNITYDLEFSEISSAGSPSFNISYDVSPNLALPSLNMSLATDSIPWLRPHCYTCWPPAINLVHSNGTQGPQKVIQTITLSPSDCTQMLVCGSGGSELTNFQIALGLTAIHHFHYALCCTAGDSGQISFGGQDPEAQFSSGSSSGSSGSSSGGRGKAIGG